MHSLFNYSARNSLYILLLPLFFTTLYVNEVNAQGATTTGSDRVVSDPLKQSDAQDAKLVVEMGLEGDQFGYSVSLSGDYALIGAPLDDELAEDAGAAYIYKKEGTQWIEHQKLMAEMGAEADWFGRSVSLSGDYALIGAYFDDEKGDGAGAAYIFKREGDTWVEQQKLTASMGAAGDNLGISVSLSGDYALVGSFLDDEKGVDAGAAYIFKREGDTWVEQQKIIPEDVGSRDWYGTSVSLSGDYALVGAHRDDENWTNVGAAYVFKREGNTWVEKDKLKAQMGAAENFFGISVSLSGDYALIGAYGVGQDLIGAAYVFKRTGELWIEQQILSAFDGGLSDQFGWSVSLSGDYALVGARQNAEQGTNAGAAYTFKKEGDSWVPREKFIPTSEAEGDNMGSAVNISGNYLLVGAQRDDDQAEDAGAVYLFTGDFGGPEAALTEAFSSLYYSSNGSNWAQSSNWLRFDQPFSTWHGVTTDMEGAVTGLDLSDNQLEGSISAELGNLTNLNVLDLSDNSGLNGTLPLELTDLALDEFYFAGTNLLENSDPAFQEWLSTISIVESTGMVNVSNEDEVLPEAFAIYQNYPNPFNRSTEFTFNLPVSASVRLSVFDISGKQVALVTHRNYPAGTHRLKWQADGLGSGIYLYKIETGTHTEIRRMIVVR